MRQRLACQRPGFPQDRLAHSLKMAFARMSATFQKRFPAGFRNSPLKRCGPLTSVGQPGYSEAADSLAGAVVD